MKTFAIRDVMNDSYCPELRCYCEAASEERAKLLVQTVLARIRPL